jgi:hypothetical protein
MNIRRVSSKRPGYDCGPDGSRCKHEKKGDHGIGGDEWLYAVTDGERAVSLLVLSGDYPPSVDRSLFTERMLKPWGAHLSVHESCGPDQGVACDLLPCGRCTVDVSYLQAADLWDAHHVGEQFEQPESFWLALEARL